MHSYIYFIQSHPIGPGPDFLRCSFNIFGKSPLVAHFLRMQKLQRESGMKVMLQRTEIDHLPDIEAKTYKDLIKESFQHVHQFHKNYERYAH